jgi:hypothetical protein
MKKVNKAQANFPMRHAYTADSVPLTFVANLVIACVAVVTIVAIVSAVAEHFDR